MVTDETVSFNVEKEKNARTREILKEVYKALTEKGYNPINQIVGYILSGDPTYITSHNNARNLIRQIEIDELLDVGIAAFSQNKRLSRTCALHAARFAAFELSRRDVLFFQP